LEGKKHNIKTAGIVINKHKKFRDELREDEIFSVIGREIPLLGKIPEDEKVLFSQRKSQPVVSHAPYSPASKEFKKLAAIIAGEKYSEKPQSVFDKLFNIFR